MNKYIIIAIIVIGIIAFVILTNPTFFGLIKDDPDNGSMDENYIEVVVGSHGGYPTIKYYHQHNKIIVQSSIIQSRYMEAEFLEWYNNHKINGVQYQSVLQQCNNLGYLPYP